jgi:phosphoribosylformylglycinamidine (FGAM) synthase PurS component
MRSEDYSIFAANKSVSMRTINHSHCKHGGFFPRALRVIHILTVCLQKQAKTQKETTNERSRMIKQLLINSVIAKYCDIIARYRQMTDSFPLTNHDILHNLV